MKRGDPDAITSALEHWPQVYGLAMVLVKDHALAEDLSQETFLRFSQQLDVSMERSVRPLLLRIVRNLALNARRRPAAISLESRVEAGGAVADLRSPDPAEEAGRQETIRSVRRALRTLSPLWQTVLYLRDGVDLSYAEIADVVAKTEDVVRVTLHRARKRIREELDDAAPERRCS